MCRDHRPYQAPDPPKTMGVNLPVPVTGGAMAVANLAVALPEAAQFADDCTAHRER